MESTNTAPALISRVTDNALLLIPGLLLFYIISSSVSPLQLGYNLYNDKRILEIIILSAVNLTGLFVPTIRLQLVLLLKQLGIRIKLLIFIFFLAGTLSALNSRAALLALADVAVYLNLLIAGLMLAAAYNVAPDKVIKFTATGIALLVILSIFIESLGLLVYLSQGKQPGSAELFAYFAHPRFFNQVQSWLLPGLFLLPAVWPDKPRIWLLAITAAAAWWALLFISGGRGSALALITSIFMSTGFWLLVKRNHSLGTSNAIKVVIAFVLAAIIGILLFFLYIKAPIWLDIDPGTVIENSSGRDLTTFNGRLSIWKLALVGMLEHPLLGIGPAQYSCLTSIEWYPAHPHSGYLQILSEWGIPAFLCFSILAVAGLKGIFRKIQQSQQYIGFVLLISLIAAAVHMSLSGLWVMPTAQVSGVLICGLTLGWVTKQSTKISSIPKNTARPLYFLPTIILLSLVIFGYFLNSQLPQLENTSRSNIKQIELTQSPGFWFEGLVCQNMRRKAFLIPSN